MKARLGKYKTTKNKIELLEKKRQAVKYRFYDKMTLKEIAEIFECTEQAVCKWIKAYEEDVFNETISELWVLKAQKYNQLEEMLIAARLQDDFSNARAIIETQIKLLRLHEIEGAEKAPVDDFEYIKLSKAEIKALEKALST